MNLGFVETVAGVGETEACLLLDLLLHFFALLTLKESLRLFSFLLLYFFEVEKLEMRQLENNVFSVLFLAGNWIGET